MRFDSVNEISDLFIYATVIVRRRGFCWRKLQSGHFANRSCFDRETTSLLTRPADIVSATRSLELYGIAHLILGDSIA